MKAKLAMIGEGGVGKTSLIRRFVLNEYSNEYVRTVGTKVSRVELEVPHGPELAERLSVLPSSSSQTVVRAVVCHHALSNTGGFYEVQPLSPSSRAQLCAYALRYDIQTGAPRYQVDFPRFGDTFKRVTAREDDSTDASSEQVAQEVLEEGPYRRSYRLARRLMGESRTQEDFVQAVMDHLRDGYSYPETPRPEATNLDGFLFDARAGYCQQFSGAMAMLLRMGGVPARVTTGFTSGSQDSKTGEYVVRDLDAHSWVEVWYAGFGW